MKNTEPLITTDTQQGVTTLTLGRAPAHPLNRAMIDALHGALEQAITDAETRVIVIHGPGHIFCAGHDLKEIAAHRRDPDLGAAYLSDLFTACSAMMVTLAHSPKPTLAIVEGIATAAGLQLVASCDLAFASDTATFALPGVTNGGYCTTPAVAVSRTIAPKHLMRLTLSGTAQDAAWALAVGLVSHLSPADRLLQTAQDFAATLAAQNPGPITHGKAAMRAQLEMPLAEAYAHATPVMVSHFMDPARLKLEAKSRFAV
ncbi:MAG: enoyl-CoA hydratase [Rhodobacterales bacterium]|nr:MAG: enoyl-CoA hydratase [Rhodobacterales bacterium]